MSVRAPSRAKRISLPKVVISAVALAALLAVGYRWAASHNVQNARRAPVADDTPGADAPSQSSDSSLPRLEVVRPRAGGLVHSTTQPGLVEAYNYANLYAKVSGYLQTQTVDIGDRVKEHQVLAQIDAPELAHAALQARAELEQAHAQLKLDEAGLATSQADVKVALANIEEKEAELKQAAAFFEFHKMRYSRRSDLFKHQAIDEREVDEDRKERDSAEAAKNEAQAAVRTAQADLGAKQAMEQQAEADIAQARAKVQVSSAVLKKANVYVEYTRLRSPYNGVVTKRSFHVGDFVRAAEEGGQTPVLTVAETDVMRVVVKVPEEFVPLTLPGGKALFKLNFTDHLFEGKVSRVANSLDRNDKTMRTEIDLPNPAGDLRDGMYGYATIELSKSLKGLSVPSRSLIQSTGATHAVFVVRDGRVHRTRVKVGTDTGLRAEILSGLHPQDLVVLHPTEDLTDGQAVDAAEVKDGDASSANASR